MLVDEYGVVIPIGDVTAVDGTGFHNPIYGENFASGESSFEDNFAVDFSVATIHQNQVPVIFRQVDTVHGTCFFHSDGLSERNLKKTSYCTGLPLTKTMANCKFRRLGFPSLVFHVP